MKDEQFASGEFDTEFLRPFKSDFLKELIDLTKNGGFEGSEPFTHPRGVLGTASMSDTEAEILYSFFPTGGGQFLVNEARDMLECQQLLADGKRHAALKLIQSKLRKFTSEGVSIRAYANELPSARNGNCFGSSIRGHEGLKFLLENESQAETFLNTAMAPEEVLQIYSVYGLIWYQYSLEVRAFALPEKTTRCENCREPIPYTKQTPPRFCGEEACVRAYSRLRKQKSESQRRCS